MATIQLSPYTITEISTLENQRLYNPSSKTLFYIFADSDPTGLDLQWYSLKSGTSVDLRGLSGTLWGYSTIESKVVVSEVQAVTGGTSTSGYTTAEVDALIADLVVRLSAVEAEVGLGPIVITGYGTYNNCALIGTNGLYEGSVLYSDVAGSDNAAGAFDGYDKSTLISDFGTSVTQFGLGRWLVTQGGVDQYIGMDFGEGQSPSITGFVIYNTEYYSAARAPQDVLWQTSDDLTTWVDQESFTLTSDDFQNVDFTTPVSARAHRLVVQTNHGNSYTEICELAMKLG